MDYFESGLCVRTPSWHAKEVLLSEAPATWEEAGEISGLGLWEPEKRCFYESPVTVPFTGDPDEVLAGYAEGSQILSVDFAELTVMILPAVDTHVGVYRNDDGRRLGVVGEGFGLVYNRVMGEVAEALMEDEPGLRFDSVGCAKGGALVWIVMKLDEPSMIAGDDSYTYPHVNLLNGHDGGSSFQVNRTAVRTVCANTYNLADMEGRRSGTAYTFRHTGSVLDRIAEAKAALTGVRQDMIAWTEMAEDLAKIRVNDAILTTFVEEFIGLPPAEAAVASDRVKDNVAQARAALKGLYLNSPTTDGHRDTGLGLVDAAVEYLDHVRGYRSPLTYVNRQLLGREPLKAKAVKLVRELAKA